MKAISINAPPDKSISHRAIILASISDGITRIENLLMGDDILRTIDAFRAMGVCIRIIDNGKCRRDAIVHGVGMLGLEKPSKCLYLGNSGTTMRILPGVLAGQSFETALEGDKSLSSRPMKRIVEPLRDMGVKIKGRWTRSAEGHGDVYPPLRISGGNVKAIKYKAKIASAQVKSCILLAGLFANGGTSVSEPVKSRDHTERMLARFGVKCSVTGLKCQVKGPAELKSPRKIIIPGDISSAAFFIVAGCIMHGMKVVLKKIGLNPTRTGILKILKRMGADIKIKRNRRVTNSSVHASSFRYSAGKDIEPAGDIVVRYSKLKGVTVSAKETAMAIDEMPILMVAACLAIGRTVIKGIGELRVKETDRIVSMVTNLRKMGADIDVTRAMTKDEVIVIKGVEFLRGAVVSSFGDHRTAMSMLIAGLAAKGNVKVRGLGCINKSFPCFGSLLKLFDKDMAV